MTHCGHGSSKSCDPVAVCTAASTAACTDAAAHVVAVGCARAVGHRWARRPARHERWSSRRRSWSQQQFVRWRQGGDLAEVSLAGGRCQRAHHIARRRRRGHGVELVSPSYLGAPVAVSDWHRVGLLIIRIANSSDCTRSGLRAIQKSLSVRLRTEAEQLVQWSRRLHRGRPL